MPLRRRASSASPSSLLLLLLLVALLAGPAAAAGPIRFLGPEGYISSVGELRFPSPQDSGHMLATQAHDLWESRDGGASWRSLLSPPNQELGRLAIDPFDRAHWLIGGIGAGAPLLYETRDGGRTWSSRTWPVVAIRPFIVFDDRVAGRIVVEEPGVQLILSRDGGVTWEAISPPSSPFPVFSPFLLGVRQSQFYFSWRQELWAYNPDSGTWSQVSNGSVGTLSEMWPDATNPNILFARYSDNLFRSNDGGRSFVQILDTGGGNFDFRQSRTNPSHLAVLAKTSLHLSLDRGSTWSSEPLVPSFDPSGLAFDPVNGELVFHENEALVRRHADGSRTPFRPRGLFAVTLADFQLDPARGQTYAVTFGGAFYRRDALGRWSLVGQTGCRDPKRISVTPWNPERIYLTCHSQAYLFSDDGGATWSTEGFAAFGADLWPNRIVFTPGDPGRPLLLVPQYFIRPIDAPSEIFGGIADVAIHPDPSRGFVAVASGPDDNGAVFEWTPAAGWQELGTEFGYQQRFLAQDPRQPDHLLAISEWGESSVSFDRGRTWEARGNTQPQIQPNELGIRPSIDPGNSNHIVVSGATRYETWESTDGAASWQRSLQGFRNYGSEFDSASNLLFAANGGLFMRGKDYQPCAGHADNYCLRQGRFEMTVDWKTPNGNTGVARKVVTGSEESGLFYFFDQNNWELLVKVLDGCAINQRFWVFAAGTTDVEYLLKVEDLLTGKVRTYFNKGGQAAAAIGDIDAFATCDASPAAAAPAPASFSTAAPPAGDGQEGPPLELLGGRFVVKASWKDFAGQEGFGTPTPLRSANSGLFWFFSPDNWEVLVKVLDGCAINGHYWVLAAATTDVGYEIEVGEPGGGPPKTYTNPVGRPSPAQIDLAAFACGR